PVRSGLLPPVALTADSLSVALARGGCPFQLANLCGVHAIKPLGCRVYFCDRSAQRWQQELSESMLAQIRATHARHAIAYRCAERAPPPAGAGPPRRAPPTPRAAPRAGGGVGPPAPKRPLGAPASAAPGPAPPAGAPTAIPSPSPPALTIRARAAGTPRPSSVS